MAVDRADLAGDVEARNRFFHRIQYSLLDIVLWAALGIVNDGPGFHAVEGWRSDRDHRFRGPSVICIVAFTA